MIVGIGVDIVDIDRFARVLRRRPAVADRLFTAAERTTRDGGIRTAASLAGRFAAKEAVIKAMGGPLGLQWHDCEVVSSAAGRPSLVMSGTVAAAAIARGVETWHLSLSHDGGLSVAYVIAEGRRS